MKPEEIRFGDWAWVFFGEVPPAFFLEIILRLVFVFFVTGNMYAPAGDSDGSTTQPY